MRKGFAVCSISLVVLCGVAAAKADTCSSVAGNLVSNCGFETGNFTGWSGTSTTDNNSGVDSQDPYQGTYEAYLGSIGTTAALSQTFATVVGQQYSIQFSLDETLFGASVGYTNSFSVNFGGASLFTESNVGLSSYAVHTVSGVATSNSTTLSFLNRNDDGYFDLDDVSVMATGPIVTASTPEPSSLCLLGTGVLGVLGAARRRLRA